MLHGSTQAVVAPVIPAAVGINPHRLDAYPSKPILRQRGEAFGAIVCGICGLGRGDISTSGPKPLCECSDTF